MRCRRATKTAAEPGTGRSEEEEEEQEGDILS